MNLAAHTDFPVVYIDDRFMFSHKRHANEAVIKAPRQSLLLTVAYRVVEVFSDWTETSYKSWEKCGRPYCF